MADISVAEANLAALIEKTGYNIIQENGQRKYRPPMWLGPPPPKGSEIFIGKLPRDVFEDELVPLCEQFGQIYELRLMIDFCGINRGYAFVTYTNNEDATKAIKGLDDFEIRPDRHIGVCKSIDNCRLFIGGIPKDKSKEEIEKEVNKHTDGVSKVILYSNYVDKSKNRGFAFVEYESHRAAAMARRKLLNNGIKMFDHDIAVDWAQPEAQVEDETMRRVTVLYVRNLSSNTSEDILRSMFSMAGSLKVERVKKLRDFAFIHYYRREDAEIALKQFDGITYDGCVWEVTWAKPPESQKQRMDKNAFGNYLFNKLKYDNLDHNFNMRFPSSPSALSSYSLFPRAAAARSRSPLHQIQKLCQSFTITRPVQLLGYICLENGWGEPQYQISRVESDSEVFFVAWVVISGLPAENSRFMCEKVCRSPDEAKHYAACAVLKKLGITPDGQDFPFISPAVSMPNLSPNFPKTLSSSSASKYASPNLGFCSPPKPSSLKSRPHFMERGQGDGFPGLFHQEDPENPILDPDTPIEPNSILGLLASMAAASNADLPLFGKMKI